MKAYLYKIRDIAKQSDNDIVWQMTDPNRRIFILTVEEIEKKEAEKDSVRQ